MALSTRTPPSQKAGDRPIGFQLTDGANARLRCDLVIRPEDLTVTEPALQTVTPTFDGAWADDFGRGVATINIAGHTGWRGGKVSGLEAFQELRERAWVGWFHLREEARAAGRNPSDVKLVFVDRLDDLVVEVAPSTFVLRRNRTSPLLCRYQISMSVLSDRIDPGDATDPLKLLGAGSAALKITGIKSLDASLARIKKGVEGFRGALEDRVLNPIRGYMNMANTALQKVRDVVAFGEDLAAGGVRQLIGFASDVSAFGRNLFATVQSVVGLPDRARQAAGQLMAAFHNVFCVFRNAFAAGPAYPDYRPLYGASTCSSTLGAEPVSPLLGVNAFEIDQPIDDYAPTVTPAARSAIDTVRLRDPVLEPLTLDDLAGLSTLAAGGVRI